MGGALYTIKVKAIKEMYLTSKISKKRFLCFKASQPYNQKVSIKITKLIPIRAKTILSLRTSNNITGKVVL
jgi:hypothetical protein